MFGLSIISGIKDLPGDQVWQLGLRDTLQRTGLRIFLGREGQPFNSVKENDWLTAGGLHVKVEAPTLCWQQSLSQCVFIFFNWKLLIVHFLRTCFRLPSLSHMIAHCTTHCTMSSSIYSSSDDQCVTHVHSQRQGKQFPLRSVRTRSAITTCSAQLIWTVIILSREAKAPRKLARK